MLKITLLSVIIKVKIPRIPPIMVPMIRCLVRCFVNPYPGRIITTIVSKIQYSFSKRILDFADYSGYYASGIWIDKTTNQTPDHRNHNRRYSGNFDFDYYRQQCYFKHPDNSVNVIELLVVQF